MRLIRLSISILFVAMLFFLATASAEASEGNIELGSTAGQNSRCFANSVLMRDFNFTVVVNCRDLLYPPAPDLFSYLLWATAIKDGKAIKLGELGVGKAEFRTPVAFSNLFVTPERDTNINSPTGPVVMQGTVQSVGFLEGTPVPELQQPTPTPTPKVTSTGGELMARIRRALLTLFIGIFTLGIVAFALITTIRRLRE